MAGIFGIAVAAGVLQALATPRKKEDTKEGKEEESDAVVKGGA